MFFSWFVKDKKKQQQKKKRGAFKQKPALASYFFLFINGWVEFYFLFWGPHGVSIFLKLKISTH
jgi:hypothetical protein